MSKIKKGTGKIEFFSNFDYIKSKYDNGYVVGTELYKLIKEEKNITMSYKQFSIYFKDFIFSKDERFFSSGAKKEDDNPPKNLEKSTDKNPAVKTPKVKKIDIGANKKKISFNPHTTEIKDEDIL